MPIERIPYKLSETQHLGANSLNEDFHAVTAYIWSNEFQDYSVLD